MTDNGLIVGIDLGTTNSVVAIWDSENEKAVPLLNQEGSPLTPSAVTFDPHTGTPIVGQPALDRIVDYPEEVVHSVKRFIGLSFEDEQVQRSRAQVIYRIEGRGVGERRPVVIQASGQSLTPVEASSHILRKLKRDAELYLKDQGHPKPEVRDAVITVPAYFTESQRHATMDAGVRAGLNVRRLINEPTAAALAFDLKREAQNVVVYDLGGGTFDISIIEVNRMGMYRVVATSGDNHLGGDDFDERVANWIKERFRANYGLPLLADPHQEALLRGKAEEAKIVLSGAPNATIELRGVRAVGGSMHDLTLTLLRDEFESLIEEFILRTLALCDETLEMARTKTEGKLQAKDISQVLLVGGQTRTPAVGRSLRERYGWKLHEGHAPGNGADSGPEPDLVVGMGAAVQAGLLAKDPNLTRRVRLWDVVAQPLGIEAKGKQMPDGETMFQIIRANQQIPYRTKETPIKFTNELLNQGHIEFRVYQGTSSVADENTHLGTVVLPLVGRYEPGEAEVKCWFEIDWDGILTVHAEELRVEAPEVVEKIDYFYYLGQAGEEE
jgi:molecular chaperone DnaK